MYISMYKYMNQSTLSHQNKCVCDDKCDIEAADNCLHIIA